MVIAKRELLWRYADGCQYNYRIHNEWEKHTLESIRPEKTCCFTGHRP